MRLFEELLAAAEQMHGGHACPGQVLGVRMAMRACRELGIEEPWQATKRLIVFVETDCCAADAIAAVTGCRLGKRTLKHMDYHAHLARLQSGASLCQPGRPDGGRAHSCRWPHSQIRSKL